MKRLLILRPAASHTEAVLEVVDGFLHIDTDLIKRRDFYHPRILFHRIEIVWQEIH